MRSSNAPRLFIAKGSSLRGGFALLTFAALACLAGCGGGGTANHGTTPVAPTITWSTPDAITYGTALSSAQLDAKANTAGTFAYTPAAGTTPKAGTQTLSVDFAPTDTTDYTTATANVQLTVNQATPTVSVWPTASAITTGQALSASTLTGGTASVPGTFAWTAPSTVPAVGTDSESVTFTPTDTTDYTTVTADVSVVVNPITPQIVSVTPLDIASDNYLYNLSSTPSYTFICSGCQDGDILHDASGTFPDIILSLAAGQITFGINVQWQPGTYQPEFPNWEMQHPGGTYGNQFATAFFASASQSTLAISPTTGTLFQDEQASGQIDWQATNGTTGKFFADSVDVSSPTLVAVDDVTGKVVYAATGASTKAPAIVVFDESGDGGIALCSVNPTGMSFISSIAARGGYMVFTDPVENLVGSAKMDCSGYQTVPLAGQPWSVAMTNNGTETDAYVLSRDAWATDGKPGIVKFVAPSMTVAGSVELPIPTVTSVRATTPTIGIYQVAAFTNTPAAAVLYMSDQSDGQVLLVSTDTSNGKAMAVTNTVPVSELPFALATQESASASTLWVAYIAAAGGDDITHAGTIDPTTGTYTPAVGTCPTGILAGGFAASATQVYCAQGSTIAPLQQ